MTHPYREELAGRLERAATHGLQDGQCDEATALFSEAAAALRQSPTVEEVARERDEAVKLLRAWVGPKWSAAADARKAARHLIERIDRADLYGRRG